MNRAEQKAAPLCQEIDLSDEARKLLDSEISTNQFFGKLCQTEHYPDAVRILAVCLSKQEAVWWGSLCVWHGGRPEPPPADAAALHAAVRWVLEPSEENRRAARAPGQAAGAARPAGGIALAAFWSGGSMTPPDLPPVAPPANLTARTIASAILTAAAQGDPAQRGQRFRQFLQLGVDVVKGASRWSKGGPVP